MLKQGTDALECKVFAAGNLMPGVRIKDNGPKAGLNGVDNGECLRRCFAADVTRLVSTLACYQPAADVQRQLSFHHTGQIWFDDVKVPRDDMLDAFASVAPDGRSTWHAHLRCAMYAYQNGLDSCQTSALTALGALQAPTAVPSPMLVPASAQWWVA